MTREIFVSKQWSFRVKHLSSLYSPLIEGLLKTTTRVPLRYHFVTNEIQLNKLQHSFGLRLCTCGFNCSVNIPESYDFRSQFDPLNIVV